MTLTDNEQFFNPFTCVCVNCKHFDKDLSTGVKCKAFPDGIPEKILDGTNKHDEPLNFQDNNIVFTKN